VAQQVVSLGLLLDILKEDRGSLDELHVYRPIVQVEQLREVLHHIVLNEHIEVGSVHVLLRVDDILSDVPHYLSYEKLVRLVYYLDGLQTLD